MQGRNAWESFLTGEEPKGLRDEVLTSWRRSKLSGVSPVSVDFVRTDIDVESRFARIAIPLMNEMAELLAGTDTCLAMANSSAHVVWRWAPDSHLRSALDSAGLLVGHSFDEEIIGTNAVGTSLEVGRTTAIRSEEHFRESFHAFNCVATPVIDPITHRSLGTINITWPPGYTEETFAPIVQKMAREIQNALKDASDARERRLLQAFMDAKSASSLPVVALNSEIIIGNHFASDPHFRHDMLWAKVLDTVDSDAHAVLESHDGTTAQVRAIHEGRSLVGAVLVFDQSVASAGSTASTVRPRFSGRAGVADAIDSVTRTGGRVVLRGEPGVGKRAALAEAIGVESMDIVDAGDAAIEGRDAWLERLRAALASEKPVLLAHLDQLDVDAMRAASRVIASTETSSTICATITTDRDGESQPVEALIDALDATVLDLSPLRNRIEEIPALAREFAGRVDISPEAMTELQNYPWPGNVSELRQTIRSAIAMSDDVCIRPDDLPDRVRGAQWSQRHLTLLERAEADVIARVLDRCGGNKTLAAKELGLSRPTLYAKIRAYRIPNSHKTVPCAQPGSRIDEVAP